MKKCHGFFAKVLVLVMVMLVFAAAGSVSMAAEKELLSKASIDAGITSLGSGNTGNVIVQFDLVSTVASQDAFIGLADLSASPKAEKDFPIVLKLNADTTYTLNSDSELTADNAATYSVDNYDHFKLVINLATKKYDAYYTPDGVDPVLLAEGYSFKSGVAIDDIGKLAIYTTADGTLKVKNILTLPAEAPYGQWRSGFLTSGALHDLGTANTGVVTTEFDFTALMDGISGAIAYVDTDDTAPVAYSGLPIIIMPNVETQIFDVRNGSAYEHLGEVKYEVGKKIHFKCVIDLTNQTLDVFGDGVQIADDYKFREGANAIDDLGKFWPIAKSGIDWVENTFVIENHTLNGVPTVPATPAPAPAPTPAPAEAPAAEPAAEANPDTSDASMIPYLLAAAVSGAAGLAVSRKKK